MTDHLTHDSSQTVDTSNSKTWQLKLYVAGQTPKSIAAFKNLKTICETHLQDQYSIEVIDLSKQPHLAFEDSIIALPTLVKKFPQPIKKFIGDLSNAEKVLVGLQIVPITYDDL